MAVAVCVSNRWQVTGDSWQLTVYRWQVTGDRWQLIGDRWHMTRDKWHMTHSVGWTFSQNFSSPALPVWDWQCLEDIWTKVWINQSINQSINAEGDCRRDPGTPGLLIFILKNVIQGSIWMYNKEIVVLLLKTCCLMNKYKFFSDQPVVKAFPKVLQTGHTEYFNVCRQ